MTEGIVRDLNYSIRFGKDLGFMLTREMTLVEGEEIQAAFLIEDPQCHGIQLAPAELAELHRYIHEMLRMAEQHRDALTDGESVGMVERAVAREDGEQPDPAPDEGEREQVVVVPDETPIFAILQAMDNGLGIWPNHPAFAQLLVAGFLACEANPSKGPQWRLSDAGRARLAAQTPEAESGMTLKTLADHVLRILCQLANGQHLAFSASRSGCWFSDSKGQHFQPWAAYVEMQRDGLIEVEAKADYAGTVVYRISDAGRRVLAEREG